MKLFNFSWHFNLIFFFLLYLIFLYLYYFNYISNVLLIKNQAISNLKVCICTLGKEENRYIKEFVELYKNYSVDKIYLYDNNDIDGERFDDVIDEYIKSGFVEIMDWRGVKGTSTYFGIMDSCYQTFHEQYDWLIFYELDEFLYLKNFQNIKEFLYQNKFNNCQSIQLNWVHMSDNNHLYYENKPLFERFPEKGKNIVKNKYNKICFVKTIIRGHLKNLNITDNHLLSKKIKACNGFGKKSPINGVRSVKPDYTYYYIKHYYGKSVQEFVEKIIRGDLLRGNPKKVVEWAFEKFFYINEITEEKIKYIQNKFGSKYNLSKYILKIKT